MQSCPHSTPHEMWMRRTMLTAVLEFCWQQHSTRKKVGWGEGGEEEGVLGHWTGARTRSKQEASARGTAQKSLLGRWLHRQSKGEPLVQNQNKKKTRANGGKYAARSTAKTIVRAVAALQHACCPRQMCTCAPTTVRTGSTQPGGAKSLQHTETKKGFLSRVPKKTKRPAPAPGCSNVLQARGVCCNTHTAHGFCAIDGCVTGAGKDGLCTKHAAFGLCTLNTCSTAADRRRIVRQAWRWQHSSVQP